MNEFFGMHGYIVEMGEITTYTDYLTITTASRYEIRDITGKVERVRSESGLYDGTILVSTMHITSSVFVNDHESGLWRDILEWVEKLAPAGLDYAHHQTGEDNGDAHLKRMLLGHQVIVPVTAGRLDLGPWERVHYGSSTACAPSACSSKRWAYALPVSRPSTGSRARDSVRVTKRIS